MKNLVLVVAILFVVSHTAYLPAAYGQGNNDKITAMEKTAAQDVADYFIRRLEEAGDIEPLTKDMFVSDFIARYVKEQKGKLSDNNPKSETIFYAPGLEYDSVLLDQATEDDWRQFYFQTFNFMQYGFVVVSNKTAKTTLKGEDPEIDERILDEMYPQSVVQLFDANPILRNFIRKKDKSTAIKTIDELRSATKTLAEAMNILHQRDGTNRMKMNGDSKAVQKVFAEKIGSNFGPMVVVNNDEYYGFPKRTGFISVLASVGISLLIVKTGVKYKIVKAEFSSPD